MNLVDDSNKEEYERNLWDCTFANNIISTHNVDILCNIYLFIYYMVYTHVKSFAIVKNCKS